MIDVVKELYEEKLQEEGYAVMIAETVPEALAIFEKNRENLDLVITDVRPHLDGLEVLKSIKERWLKFPVILTTVYTEIMKNLGA